LDLLVKKLATYELIDSGNERKLERIGNLIIDRPTPHAIWNKRLPKRWQEATSLAVRKSDGGGFWQHKVPPPAELFFEWNEYKFELNLTQFGHCGIFFEQIAIWEKLIELVKENPNKTMRVANLFGYTGAASIILSSLGCEVFHVDSAQKINEWGKKNESLNQGLCKGKINWITDDVMTYMKSAQKKGLTFDAILMDPPTWGSGVKKGEKWVFEKNVRPLFEIAAALISKNGFLLSTTHTPGVQKETLANLIKGERFDFITTSGDIGILHSCDDRVIAAGIYALGKSK